MQDSYIPQELVELVRQRRVIPFIGAGFSFALGLPTWEQLLSVISKEVQTDIDFDALQAHCGRDFLQLAEYFYVRSDRSIGPLRHVISRALALDRSPLQSPAHIDLLNLGAPQIYTTNYDEAIEATYGKLGELVDVVALPKHVAKSDGQRTQVVKFHGDLRHDQTLVLTESSYYARLDFESPMDLKFRSDILGKSVLFIGYGFADINIRIIWFKLMRMMKDIRPEDRPKSYMVTFEQNPVRETLYEEVGIKTIVLPQPTGKTAHDPKTAALAEFLNRLAMRSSTEGEIPGAKRPQYVSGTTIREVAEILDSFDVAGHTFFRRTSNLGEAVQNLARRRIPTELRHEVKVIPERILNLLVTNGYIEYPGEFASFAIAVSNQIGIDKHVAGIVAICLARKDGRRVIYSDQVKWTALWAAGISEDAANFLFMIVRSEIKSHKEGRFDHDLAYAASVVAILARDKVSGASPKISAEAQAILEEIAQLYPEAGELFNSDLNDNPAGNTKRLISAIDAAELAKLQTSNSLI